MTLDGVVQAPGGPEEDKSGAFKFGGWVAPLGDAVFAGVIQKQMEPADLLLGRKTFENFASYWPKHAKHWPGINEATKYVMSRKVKKSRWQNSVFLKTVADIKKLKKSEGSALKVWGSSNLVQTLLKHDLVDELWLKIFPLTLGKGKRLFSDGTIPATFTVTESLVTPSGIIIANYKRAGKVKTGTIGA